MRMGLIGRHKVDRNRLAFRRFEEAVAGEYDLARQLEIVRAAAAFARQSGCGAFASATIERAFRCRAAELGPVPVHEAVPGTVLMVMSEAYAWGGHTRAVERWIEADGKHCYSVVVTRQAKDVPFPERLRAAVDRSGGEIVLLDAEEPAEVRAKRLRELSSRFAFVVLHIHPDDPLPIMAYGTEEFPRPVGLYDHLDYGFWLGVGIADGVGELREWGCRLSLDRRGVEYAKVLGIPGDSVARVEPDRLANRRKLGLPEDARIVVTAGAAYKYQAMPGRDFLDIARPLLESSDKTYVIGIGMTFGDFPEWKRFGERFGGRFRALGRLPHEEMMAYLAAADVATDSWPVPGFTSLADAVACGCPVLTCPTPGGLMDWMEGSAAECASPDELVGKALKILADPAAGKANLDDVGPRLEASRSPEAFVEKVNAFFADLAGRGHAVRDFSPVLEGDAAFDDFLAHLQTFDLNWMAERWFRERFGRWDRMTVSFACDRHPLRAPVLWAGWALHGFRGTDILRDWLPYCLVERRLRRQEGTESYFRWARTCRIKHALKYWLPHRFVQDRLSARCERKTRTAEEKSPSAPRSGFSGSIDEAVRRIVSRRDDASARNREARIAVCLHLFYLDLWPIVRAYLENLSPYRWDLYVTYPDGLIPTSTLDAVKAFKPDVRLLPCRNAGYDIGPFVEALRQIDLNAYDIVFKLQTKGCHREKLFMYDQLFKGPDWFFNLYDGILDGRTVHAAVAALTGGGSLLAAAENLVVKDPAHKRQLVQAFCKERSLPYEDDYRFVAGTCFAARPEALSPLKGLGLKLSDFADTVRGDFSLAHALERWMCFAAAGRICGLPVPHATYPEEEVSCRASSFLRMLEDDRFELDPEFVYRVLERVPAFSYEVAEIPVGEIRRVWTDGRSLPLAACAPYRYLEGDGDGYDRYCAENAKASGFEMSRTRFEALRQSMATFDPRRMPVVYGDCNVILDGQHRSCILLKRFGPAHRVKVVRIFPPGGDR